MIQFREPRTELYDPRHVAITAKLTCPRCHKCQFQVEPQSGRLFMTCEVKSCRMEWWCVALPPYATGLDLGNLLGMLNAAAIIRHAIPAARELPEDALWPLRMAGGDAQAYVQVALRPRERHLYRRSDVSHMLRALKVVPDEVKKLA